MALDTTSGAGILSPEQVQQLVIQPLLDSAIVTQTHTVLTTNSVTTRLPIIEADATNSWTPENQLIEESSPDVGELAVTPLALKGFSVVSNELVADANESTLAIVGEGLVRDLQVKLDLACFNSAGATLNGPAGIESVAYQEVSSTGYGDLDPFAEALSKAETVGATITGWVTNPATALTLTTLKTADGYYTPLLGPDPTNATRRSIFGVPLYISPSVEDGVVWGIPKSKAFFVLRQGASVTVDTSVRFQYDQTAIRCVLRAGFGWPHEAGIIKITSSPST